MLYLNILGAVGGINLAVASGEKFGQKPKQ
jgi:hypothetical protein